MSLSWLAHNTQRSSEVFADEDRNKIWLIKVATDDENAEIQLIFVDLNSLLHQSTLSTINTEIQGRIQILSAENGGLELSPRRRFGGKASRKLNSLHNGHWQHRRRLFILETGVNWQGRSLGRDLAPLQQTRGSIVNSPSGRLAASEFSEFCSF